MSDYKARLLHQLQSSNPSVRSEATNLLWQWWFSAAGPEGAQQLQEAERLTEQDNHAEAEALLDSLLAAQPDFAEAWNRRATLRYVQRRYAESLADCKEVVRLEPAHFGAWHGIGLSLLALHRYDDAAAAFRRALEIQPFAQANHELLRTCLSKLN
jgi:tetratricopeptide (TPR) repeat protein